MDPLKQLQLSMTNTRMILSRELEKHKGIKFNETLVVTLRKTKEVPNRERPYSEIEQTAYFNCRTTTTTNVGEIRRSLEGAQEEIITNVSVWLSEGSGLTIKSIDEHHLSVVRYSLLAGATYIELPRELQNSMKGLINLQNKDNECFRWCHVRCLHPQNKDPKLLKKSDKDHSKKLNYDVKDPVKIRR